VRKSEIFSTATDNQTSVEVHVLQGERELARDNRTLGKFHLMGIAPAPRGVPQIEVSFDIDANGIVNVSAKDMATGREQAITITSSSGLSKEEVEKMVSEADAHREEDRRNREAIEARNGLDSLVHATEKNLDENRGQIDATVQNELETAIEEAKRLLNEQDVDAQRLKEAGERLSQASHRLAESLYQNQTSQSSGANGPIHTQPSGKGMAEDEVVDAEYTEVH
jgi:molecular chaperone DnaK